VTEKGESQERERENPLKEKTYKSFRLKIDTGMSPEREREEE
jgi:hypothetical protein